MLLVIIPMPVDKPAAQLTIPEIEAQLSVALNTPPPSIYSPKVHRKLYELNMALCEMGHNSAICGFNIFNPT